MRVRTYGLILLGVAGIAPLAAYGTLVIQQSQRAASEQACAGSERLTRIIVDRVQAFAEVEVDVLETMGIGTLQAEEPEKALRAFELGRRYSQFQEPAVYRQETSGQLKPVAGKPRPGTERVYEELARNALQGEARHSGLEDTRLPGKGEAHVITIAVPVRIAGKISGAIAATYDTMGMWRTVNEERIDQTGYAAIVTPDGRLLAHGNTDKRRDVFPTTTSPPTGYKRLVDFASGAGSKVCRVLDGNVVSIAKGHFFGNASKLDRTPEIDGKNSSDNDDDSKGVEWYVVIEQSGGEAFAEARTLTRTLLIVGASVLILVLVTSVLGGRHLVRALEDLRAHTRRLGQDLEAKNQIKSWLLEVRVLAHSLDDMADSLIKERNAARARERLATFARVAAGLAHDLRLPIEAVRGACERANAMPSDEPARLLLKKVTERELPRLKRYVDDLGRLARKENIELEYQATPIDALLDDIRNELATTPKWQGVAFVRVGRTEPASVTVDRNLIRRAVMNLAGNAADACLEKSLDTETAPRAVRDNRVTIELADSSLPEFFEIRIIDTGTGISTDRLTLLQEGDFQSTKRSTGVGLGLGVAKQIAAAHNGELLMSSSVGSGSTFTLRLPRSNSMSIAYRS